MKKIQKPSLPCHQISLCSLLLALLLCLAACARPAPLDYDRPENWAFFAEGQAGPADVFLIAPTVALGKDGRLNADCRDPSFRHKMVGALNMQRGIYQPWGRLFAPYYRQATLKVFDVAEDRREEWLRTAYADVRSAFMTYLRTVPDRPFVLAGFSQGADMGLRLLKEFLDDPACRDRLVAAYLIGWRVTDQDLAEFPRLRMAQEESDTGVIISFNCEAERIQSSLFVSSDQRTHAINPLNWRTDSRKAGREANRGACFTDYSGTIVREVPALTGAYLDTRRGTLKVPDIQEDDYPGVLFANGIYHLYDYQFFYRNLQENVGKRIAAFASAHTER